MVDIGGVKSLVELTRFGCIRSCVCKGTVGIYHSNSIFSFSDFLIRIGMDACGNFSRTSIAEEVYGFDAFFVFVVDLWNIRRESHQLNYFGCWPSSESYAHGCFQ